MTIRNSRHRESVSTTALIACLILFCKSAFAVPTMSAGGAIQQPSRSSSDVLTSHPGGHVVIVPDASPREQFGADELRSVLGSTPVDAPENAEILIGQRSSRLFDNFSNIPAFAPGASEAFRLLRRGNQWLVIGSDASGVLYGCLELSSRIRSAKALPEQIDFVDQPALRIRATNLFWMKTGGNYDWAVVPENFPWFFNRELMTRYLDLLAENRFNTIVFWNGHPFPYFLPLERVPRQNLIRAAVERFLTVKAIEGSPLQSELGGDVFGQISAVFCLV